MARSHNPFAAKEASTLDTPWGAFEVAAPNKTRLARITAVQKRLEELGEDPPIADVVAASIEMAAAGVTTPDELEKALSDAWERDEITLLQLREAAEFIGEEIRGEGDSGND